MLPMKLGSINGFSKKKLDHRNIGATKELKKKKKKRCCFKVGLICWRKEIKESNGSGSIWREKKVGG